MHAVLLDEDGRQSREGVTTVLPSYWQPLARVLGRCHVDSCAVDTGGVEAVTSKGPNTCFSLQLRLDASLLLMESAAAASLIWWMKTKTPVAHCRDNKKSEICTADAFSPLWVAPLWSLRRDNFFFFFLKRSRPENVQIELIRALRGIVAGIWWEYDDFIVTSRESFNS